MEFSPTYLYIKQHAVTGLLYFGKTTRKDPIKYLGSGKYWQNHIDIHGTNHVVTLWHELFTNRDECVNFALQFSKELNIVKSDSWANLIEENGINGGSRSEYHTDEAKQKMRAAKLGKPHSPEHRDLWRIAVTGKTRTTETKMLMSNQRKGKSQEIVRCPHCMQAGGKSNMMRWHFSNCRHSSEDSSSPE